jgi:hypothetical protein
MTPNPEEPTIERLVELARGKVSAEDAAALRARLATRPEWVEAFGTIDRLARVLDGDATDAVPPEATARARELGRRLALRAQPGMVERLAGAVARLLRDTRLDVATAGLRGQGGFACAYAADGLEVELECTEDRRGGFRIEGQVTGAGWTSIEFRSEDDRPVRSSLDADGMFVVSLAGGTYEASVSDGAGRSVRIEHLEVP